MRRGEEQGCLVFYARRKSSRQWCALSDTLLTFSQAREWIADARVVGRAIEACEAADDLLQIRLVNPGPLWSPAEHAVVDREFFRGVHGVRLVASVTFAECLPPTMALFGADFRVREQNRGQS